MQQKEPLPELAQRLAERAPELALALLGDPNQRGRTEWRWGRRGSLALVIAGPKRGRWHDHEAGQGGDMLAFIVRQRGGTLADAARWARAWLGEAATRPEPQPRKPPPAPEPVPRDTARLALEIWHGARESIAGTPAEKYLLGRGLDPARLPPHAGLAGWPPALRWHAGREGLVIGVNGAADGLIRAVQIVLLRRDGAPVLRDGRKMRLTLGSLRGNAVRFAWQCDPRGRWALAEGVETAFAASMLLQCPVWASLGASNLPCVKPPPWARECAIVADHDAAGLRAAELAAARIAEGGLPVTIIRPSAPGADAADLVAEGGRHVA